MTSFRRADDFGADSCRENAWVKRERALETRAYEEGMTVTTAQPPRLCSASTTPRGSAEVFAARRPRGALRARARFRRSASCGGEDAHRAVQRAHGRIARTSWRGGRTRNLSRARLFVAVHLLCLRASAFGGRGAAPGTCRAHGADVSGVVRDAGRGGHSSHRVALARAVSHVGQSRRVARPGALQDEARNRASGRRARSAAGCSCSHRTARAAARGRREFVASVHGVAAGPVRELVPGVGAGDGPPDVGANSGEGAGEPADVGADSCAAAGDAGAPESPAPARVESAVRRCLESARAAPLPGGVHGE